MSFFDVIQSFDTSVLEFIQNTFKCSFLDPIMAFFSYMGEMGLFWIAVGIVFIIFKKTRSMGVMMLVAMAIGFLVGEIGIKNLINRPRPFMVNIDYSARPSELNPDFGLNIAIPSGSRRDTAVRHLRRQPLCLSRTNDSEFLHLYLRF